MMAGEQRKRQKPGAVYIFQKPVPSDSSAGWALALRASCLGYFDCCCDKLPDNSNTRNKLGS